MSTRQPGGGWRKTLGGVMMRTILTISLVLVLALCAYLGSYFALVQVDWGDANLGFVWWYPTYRFSGPWPCGLVGTLYEPAHRLDRRFLRPGTWVEKQDLLALLAADLARERAALAPNPCVERTGARRSAQSQCGRQ